MICLVLVGTSHHRAPVALREQVALDRDGAQALAARLAADGREAACLSTCNRTELYVAADDAEQAERDLLAQLHRRVVVRRADEDEAQHQPKWVAGKASRTTTTRAKPARAR